MNAIAHDAQYHGDIHAQTTFGFRRAWRRVKLHSIEKLSLNVSKLSGAFREVVLVTELWGVTSEEGPWLCYVKGLEIHNVKLDGEGFSCSSLPHSVRTLWDNPALLITLQHVRIVQSVFKVWSWHFGMTDVEPLPLYMVTWWLIKEKELYLLYVAQPIRARCHVLLFVIC